jgi:glycosyltransferase involved in cell wall biosynthesis
VTEVSVFIPCYNGERVIARSIESLLAQTHRPAEIVVVDDGSTDRSLEVAARYPVRIVRHDGNRGVGAARNSGYREVRHELVGNLDADCAARPTWLERLLACFTSPDVAGAAAMVVEAVLDSRADRWRAVHMPLHFGAERIVDPDFLVGAGTVYRRSVIMEVGGYDERLRTSFDDSSISALVRRAGYTQIYEPAACVDHLKRDSVLSALDTYWRWRNALPDTHPWTARMVAGRFRRYARQGARRAREDWAGNRRELIPIDAFAPLYLLSRDVRQYVRSTGRPVEGAGSRSPAGRVSSGV